MIAAEELCGTLGIGGVAPIDHHGRIDEERLARAHRELTSVSPKELTRAVARVWRRLFGRELPALRHAG
jgi:hypothetical protein